MYKAPTQLVEGDDYRRLCGAGEAWLYLHPWRVCGMRPQGARAIDEAYKAGYLGKNILGKRAFDCDIYIHMGAGSICSVVSESALVSSLMGERACTRLKFPHAPLHHDCRRVGLPHADQQLRIASAYACPTSFGMGAW